MDTFWIGVVAGMVIGSALGFFCASLLVCSRERTFWAKEIKKEDYDALA